MNRGRDEYLACIDDLAGGGGKVYDQSDRDDAASTLVIAYDHVPQVGHMTAFSFGLSNATHSEWTHGKLELMISVTSMDHMWALCIGEIIKKRRGSALFEYGTVIHFGERIADDCSLTSFFVFASTLLDEAQRSLELFDRRVNIAQIYPIYPSEAQLVRDIGAERFFWDLGIDFSDLRRRPAQLD